MPTREPDDTIPGHADYAETVPEGIWAPDILGRGFAYTNLHHGRDPEADDAGVDGDADLVSTLLRYRPEHDFFEFPRWPFARRRPRTAVLYLHGWSDYFYNVEVAEFWEGLGARFYALDLRRYGRSLRPWQTPGFTSDLAEYDDDLESALRVIRADLGDVERIILAGHSTGGLIASLWVDRNPSRVDALVLNSPWLETQGSWVVRLAAAGIVDRVARRRPKALVPLPDVDYYWQSLSNQAYGQWDLHPLWRPRFAFPIRAGWMAAVLEGHARVAAGLDIRVPVLVLTSDHTVITTRFTPEHLEGDAVIEVDVTRQRALRLGLEVTVVAVPDATHDLFASKPVPRAAAYAAIRRWATGYASGLSAPD
ncbi:alpha/beta hydrolase [Zhihengliuella halotolerans]|uniref:Alpha-beta hydrolase superfamily lysophospholipase n=1 Tax=Zhihengliuella halotolerans TaxID=370736 RepID=A0A4Q8AB46_9MICC|nr:alpha/beta hydrolase [Zhihengliuella halotolerans]RZU61372.1 alpha-beta hydrolase superfamily lysophospholipase [Zhihengliuella halotolerans]